MYISARERQILEILLTESNELTVKDLADKIGVSGRTVHRDLKNVEDILEEYNLILQKKSGVGIQITGDKTKIRDLEMFLFNLYHTEYTPDERQTMILCTLLESNEPVKLLGLANDLNVTIATVSNDLTKLEDSLKSFGLSLIRRRGYGVEIEGSETAKRKAMRSLIAENLDESEILSLAKENIQKRSNQQIDTVSEKLLGLVERKKLLIVENVIESISQELPFSMADSAYIGLVVHLALAVERIQKGEGITIDPSYLENQQSTKEYLFAKKIVEQLEQSFQITIPEAEIGYITMHLMGAKLRHDHEYLMEASSLQAGIKTKDLIEYVERLLDRDLTNNRSLFEGLMMHLKPALYRIKQNMGISNPLLEKIKNDYGELFSVVKEAVEQVFFEFHVPDEEIGYLVMHFGAAVLGNKVMGELNTLVICSSGIGTSKMLVTRLQKEFPELDQIQNISVMEFKKMKASDYHLVISTIPIPGFQEDYILVSPILNKVEIEKIRTVIAQLLKKNAGQKKTGSTLKTVESKKSVQRLVEEMDSVQDFAKAISKILIGFDRKELDGYSTIEDLLTQACQELYADQKIKDREEVVFSLIEREKLGGLGITGTTMALYHARSVNVIAPTFTIYTLKNPIEVPGMDNAYMKMKHLVLLLAPVIASEEEMEVLSFLSSLLIESEETISIFQSENKEQISALLTSRFDQFFTEKLQEIRSV
ncbi:BglG family transcription antiterminator [Neobacillus ginsengisoli]|uniref:Mannitol operon transcriptional antiterminator n=1 Tax=Neobacillus ginsengisoli TaxID=904295 RepID=A0ABT9Y2N5_9BACI|nr:BglG family transcription antiterminator [Neobacillus ginsengisoli]MDQ0202014.1 mannitol operon transcriptional antiterminator [Neobacillus ginsengisoli]